MKQNVVPRAAESDVVGDRVRLVTIGMLAVLAACAVFAVLRLVTTLADQRATPWYVNALGAVVMAVAFVWFRRAPARRSDVAVHVTAGTALVALVIPVAFGMSSSIWWLSLIAFAVLLMGHAVEGRIWAAAAVVTTIAFTLLEPSIQVEGAVPEPMSEVLASRVAFVAVLLVMAVAFRAEAERRARELSETADALQRAGQVKSRFLAHMSHEVRTPLHGVIASTSMALEEPLAPEARAHLEAAQQSAGLLLGMLSNLLDYARAEADALELRRVPFDLHATVSQLLAPLAAQALMRGLAFEATAAPGLPAKRLGDATRITQIVLNLVQNALKYTTSGGVKVRLAAGAGAADVVIEVEDSGPGIAEERLQEIFEPFIQLAPDDRGAFGGVGLGLAIVRETLRVMEGSVEVRSTVGQGATFVVTMPLPLVEGAAPGPTDLLAALPRLVREPAAGPTRPLRVLVAEDYPMNQRVMREMLERAHHTVRLVADGEEAWQVLQAESFDVLLSDVEMPRMGGLELTARVRARELAEGRPRMPIIGVTAHVGPDERHRLIEGGMDDHLTKPFTPSDLAAALSRAVPDEAPAAAPPDDVFEALLDLPGLAGARAAIGSLAIAPIELRTMLMEFLEGERGAPDAMREDLAAGRRDAARRRAHGIKGGAAMVGATRLEASARALDDALRGEPAPVDTEPLLAMLAAEVDALLADLRRHAERHPAERHPAERHPAERHPAERHPAERPS